MSTVSTAPQLSRSWRDGVDLPTRKKAGTSCSVSGSPSALGQWIVQTARPFVKNSFWSRKARSPDVADRETAGRSPPLDSYVPQETLPLVPRREESSSFLIGIPRRPLAPKRSWPTWRTRSLERLAKGPPICCDGGMGALIASAVAALRCPEEANIRAPESVVDLHLGFIRAGAELIETNTFGGNRRKLASHFLENELEAINSAGVKLARDAREISGKEVFIAGSIGPLGDVGDAEDSGSTARRAGGRARRTRRRPVHGRDVLRPRRARARDRGRAQRSPLPVVALMTFDEDAETLGGVKAAAAAERLRRARRRGDGREPRRRAPGGAGGARGDGRRRAAARGAAEPRPREPRRRARDLSARDARVLRRVRCAGAQPRRRLDRRLLRHDADRDRRHSRRARRGARAERLLRRRRARARRPLDGAGAAARRELARDLRDGRFVVSVQIDPPLGGDYSGPDRHRRRDSATPARRATSTSTTTRRRARS